MTIPVTYEVAPAKPAALEARPSPLLLYAHPAAKDSHFFTAIELRNVGSGTLGPLHVFISADSDTQLTLSGAGATLPATGLLVPEISSEKPLLFGVRSTGTFAGVRKGKISIRDEKGATLLEIPVVIEKLPPVGLSLAPLGFLVGAFADPTTPPLPVRIPLLTTLTLKNGGDPLEFSAFATVPWLHVTPSIGMVGSQTFLDVVADPGGLKPGGYYGGVSAVPTGPNSASFAGNARVVMEVVPSTSAIPNTLFPTAGYILVPKTIESFGLDLRTSVKVDTPVTITDNYQGGRAFFTHTPATLVALAGQVPHIMVDLATPPPPPGVYHGELVVQVGTERPQRFPILGVVPAVSAPSPQNGSRQAAVVCTAQRILPTIAAPLQNFNVLTGWPTPIDVTVVDNCGSFDNTGSVLVSFSNGDPTLNMTPLDNGRWSATWIGVHPSDNVIVTVTAVSSDTTLSETAIAGGSLAANPANPPLLFEAGTLNGASFEIGGTLSPGSFVSLFGSGLADSQLSATSVPLPNTLAGASVQIGGQDAPLYFANDGQVNAVVPYGLPVDVSTPVVVTREDAISFERSIVLTAAAPGIFAYGDGEGIVVGYPAQGAPALANADQPVAAQEVVVAYCTGLGEVSPAVTAGTVTPLSPFFNTTHPVTMTIGGIEANVGFAGLTPGSTDLYQVNAVVPAGVAAGDRVPVVLKAAGQSSAPVYISVQGDKNDFPRREGRTQQRGVHPGSRKLQVH